MTVAVESAETHCGGTALLLEASETQEIELIVRKLEHFTGL